MQKKYQVFISSTYRDLIEERNDIAKAVLEMDHIPSGMETFLSADEETFTYIKKIIDQCDYYVLLIAGRYGAISADGLSYTEKEYDYAKASGKVILVFINKDIGKLPLEKVDTGSASKRMLDAFIKKASSNRLVTFWLDRNELKSSVIISLSKAIFQNPGVGWIRANVAASEDLLSQMNNLRTENDALRSEVDVLKSELVPKLAGLADLNDEHTFEYLESGGSVSSVKLTWREILVAIGSTMIESTDLQIMYDLIVFLGENSLVKSITGSIMRADISTIRMHFVALGMIESGREGTGGEGTVRLTDKGNKTLLEIMAVRKKQ